MYSLSLPLLSLHLRYMTDASTLAGEKVLGSFSREITLRRMVLNETCLQDGEIKTWEEDRNEEKIILRAIKGTKLTASQRLGQEVNTRRLLNHV